MHHKIVQLIRALDLVFITPTKVMDISKEQDGCVQLDDLYHVQVSHNTFSYGLVKVDNDYHEFYDLTFTAKEIVLEYIDGILKDYLKSDNKTVYGVHDVSTQMMLFQGYDFDKAYKAWYTSSKTNEVILKDNRNNLISSCIGGLETDYSVGMKLQTNKKWKTYRN